MSGFAPREPTPQLDSGLVRRLAERVVAEHDELSLTGAVAPAPDPAQMVDELVARVSGFGPLQSLLDDPEIEEIWINDPSRVFVARRGRHELTNLMLDPAQVNELVERMLKTSGRRIDISRPFVDAMLPGRPCAPASTSCSPAARKPRATRDVARRSPYLRMGDGMERQHGTPTSKPSSGPRHPSPRG